MLTEQFRTRFVFIFGLPSIHSFLSRTNLLFLGDYVDRGIFSLEVLVFLYCLKVSGLRKMSKKPA